MNQLDFNGRDAIVTGGAQGIGLAIAQRLIQSGARVHVWDRDAALLHQAVHALGSNATAMVVDVTDIHSISMAVQAQSERVGKIDVLINNSGIAGVNAPTVDYPIDAWEQVLRVNLTGPFLCCRTVAPYMVKAGYGRIVNIASVAGKEGNPNAAAYSASKAGVIALTKSLGKELAQSGVCVNCVTPAAAKTAIFDQMSEQHIQFMLSKIPMGRFGEPDEIAAMVVWLCTEDCSFTTGAVFDLSGGRATY